MAARSLRVLALFGVALLVAFSHQPSIAAPSSLPASAVFDVTAGTAVVSGTRPPRAVPSIDLEEGCHSVIGQPAITISASGSLSGACDITYPGDTDFPTHVISGLMSGSVSTITGVTTINYSTVSRYVYSSDNLVEEYRTTFSGATIPAWTTGIHDRGQLNYTHTAICTGGTPGTCADRNYSYSGTVEFSIFFEAVTGNDTKIHHIEAVQVIQTEDNVVPLVAGKSTVVRVFATSTLDRFDVTVTLKGKRGQQQLEPPIRINGSASGAFPDFDPEKSFNSFNFRLPESWITPGTVQMEAEITFDVGPGDLADPNLVNNKQVLQAKFEARKRLDVGYIPVCVTGAVDGCPDAGIAETPEIINRLFPVSNEGIIYRRIATPGLEIFALPTTRSQMKDILVRLQKRTALMALFAPNTMPDQLAAWIRPNTAPAVGRAFTLDSGGDGLSSLNVYKPQDPGDSQWTLAHEIAHNLGRSHPATDDACDAKATWTDWPFPTATIQDIGWEFKTNNTVLPSKFDLMSYCGGDFGATQIWISPFTFTHLFDANGVPQRPHAAPDAVTTYLVMSGTVLASGTGGGLDLSMEVTSAASVLALATTGTHCIWFNTQPNGHCFDLDFYDYEDDMPVGKQDFVQIVPVPTGGFSSYKLCKWPCGLNDTLEVVTKSPNAPQIAITSPLPGTTFAGVATMSWAASDADNEVLRYTVLHSSDGGASWLPILTDAAVTSYTFDSNLLVTGPGGMFRVLASDGARTTSAEVTGITVGTARPWGDLQCNGVIDLADVLAARQAVAGLGTSAAIGCPAAGGFAAVDGLGDGVTWGDLRCNGAVDAVEVLDLLRSLAGLPVTPGVGLCPTIGEPVFATG